MRFEPAGLDGVVVVVAEPVEDERGVFARTFDMDAFAAAGLDARVAQCSLSANPRVGTLRGLHFQQAPHGEAKLVRCVSGRIFDVAVDARPSSPTYGRWQAWELEGDDYRGLFLPPGVAHGFLTLAPDSEVLYQMSVPYRADASAGIRWNDPALAIDWPAPVELLSERDRTLPPLAGASYGERS